MPKRGEILSDAMRWNERSGTGMATNAYGLYSISLPERECILQCSMLGYVTWRDTLTFIRKYGGEYRIDSR